MPHGGAGQFHKTHAAFDQTPRNQALTSENGRAFRLGVHAVHVQSGLRFVVQVGQAGDGRLHFEGEFVIANRRFQLINWADLIEQLADQTARLVERVEANRIRVIWLSIALAVVAAAMVGLFFYI